MASIPAVFRRLRSADRRRDAGMAVGFAEVEDEYREIFVAVRSAGGEEVVDSLAEWTIWWTEAHASLPPVSRLRQQALDVLADRGIEVPEKSPLRS